MNNSEATPTSSRPLQVSTAISPADAGTPYQDEHGSLSQLHSPPNALKGTNIFGLSKRNRTRSEYHTRDPLGLTLVHQPESTPSLDIIFVHGLGGTSRTTWSWERNPDLFWPERWLPLEPEIKTARILTFGYDANFAATGSAPIIGVMDFAKALLHSIKFAKDEDLEELEIGQVRLLLVNAKWVSSITS